MQMILKSMGVKVDKDEMDGYAAEVDEEATGKFNFLQFCQVKDNFFEGCKSMIEFIVNHGI